MFFYTRYPSSNMLKMFFSDVKVSAIMLILFSVSFTSQTLPEISTGLHILLYLPFEFDVILTLLCYFQNYPLYLNLLEFRRL